MKRVVLARRSLGIVGALLFFGGLLLTLWSQAWAQTYFPNAAQSRGTVVNATVGQYHLTITGYQSPNASIIIKTSTGVFLASTTADTNGYFSIPNILINSAELTYCFEAVDFRRLGKSESCITIPSQPNQDITYEDVFLPPTIGLSKQQINVGQDAIIYGYSMPGATVSLNVGGTIIAIVADNSGFYTYTYRNAPAGLIRITASATFNDEQSLDPTNEAVLEVLSVPQQITETIDDIVPDFPSQEEAFNIFPYLIAALLLLIAIGVLLYKLRFRLWVILIDFLRRRNKMHHDWFLDKW